MEDTNDLLMPLSDDVRSELVLLSSHLARQQHSPSRSHPRNDNLALVSSLSCLLTTGNKQNPKALIVNAVAGRFMDTITSTGTTNTLDYLVCTENARQDEEMVDACQEEFNRTRDELVQKTMMTSTSSVAGRSVKDPVLLEELSEDALLQEAVWKKTVLDNALLEETLFSQESLFSQEPVFSEEGVFSTQGLSSAEHLFSEDGFALDDGLHLEDTSSSEDDGSSQNEPFSTEILTPNLHNGHILLDGWNPANLRGSVINK